MPKERNQYHQRITNVNKNKFVVQRIHRYGSIFPIHNAVMSILFKGIQKTLNYKSHEFIIDIFLIYKIRNLTMFFYISFNLNGKGFCSHLKLWEVKWSCMVSYVISMMHSSMLLCEFKRCQHNHAVKLIILIKTWESWCPSLCSHVKRCQHNMTIYIDDVLGNFLQSFSKF